MSVIAPIVSAIVNSVVSAMVDAPPAPPPISEFSVMARSFPADSKRGELTPPIGQSVLISGKSFNTAPGLQVRDQQNFIVMPNTLREVVPIRYQMDQMGYVWRIWIFSAADLAAPDPLK